MAESAFLYPTAQKIRQKSDVNASEVGTLHFVCTCISALHLETTCSVYVISEMFLEFFMFVGLLFLVPFVHSH